jgi:formylglycine-generating enzyme required for sulfatase activity
MALAAALFANPAEAQKVQSQRAAPLTLAEELALKPKDSFKECDACPEMIVVPAGSFTMGSSASEPQHLGSEGPQHRVNFAHPFAVGKFSVTFAEWDACVADGGCNGYRPNDHGWGRERRPVINVSWEDAKTYLAWLSRKTGKTHRLLSESEREYVTRAGTTTPYWTGATISKQQAKHVGDGTLPVDSLQPNPWGLYHVHGNVYEWVEDCWNASYRGAPTDGSAWTAGDCGRRVLRGGSWFDIPENLRSADRIADTAGLRAYNIGFRLARSLLTP